MAYDLRYITIAGRNPWANEHNQHKRANNKDMLHYKNKTQYTSLIKYLKDPMLQDEYQRSDALYLNNKEDYIEFDLKVGIKIRVTFEDRTVPSPKAPERQMPCFVLWIDGKEICYKTSQDKLLDYISKNILKEPYREDKKKHDVHRVKK